MKANNSSMSVSGVRRMPKMNREESISSMFGGMRRGKGMYAEDLSEKELFLPEYRVHKEFKNDYGDNFNLDDLN